MVRAICQGRVATLGGPCRNLPTSGAVHQTWKMNKDMHNEIFSSKRGVQFQNKNHPGANCPLVASDRQIHSWLPTTMTTSSQFADAAVRGVYSRLNVCKRSKNLGPESRDILFRSSLSHGVPVTSLRDGGSVMQRYRVRGEAPATWANLVALAHEPTVPIATYPLASRNEAHPNNRTRRYARI